MIGDVLPNEHRDVWSEKLTQSERTIQLAQQTIYQFLLEIVRKWPPEEVLLEFKRLFLYHVDSVSASAINALYDLVLSNNEEEFRNTIKRSCYILVNNWDAARRYRAIQDLIEAFQEQFPRDTISPTLGRLRYWVDNFRHSQDYADLKLFASRYDPQQADQDGPWAKRYTAYLLVPQYVDLNNPIEQREAARAMAQQLRDQFKFELAMYVARSQAKQSTDRPLKNPTVLGDDVLRLIKTIVAKRGSYSYPNLANIFLNQVRQVSYREFKLSLRKYLVFSIESNDFSRMLQTRLTEKLDPLYEEHHNEPLTDAMLLRTCNRVIDYLTTETHNEPSSLFALLLSQGNPMTLVIALLKLVLVSRNSRVYLETRIADLIRYYENFPEEDCHWVVNFLEIFNVTFTIYAENVQYNLIRMAGDRIDEITASTEQNLDAYRIFSQLKSHQDVSFNLEFADDALVTLDDEPPTQDLSDNAI
ncbi:MAG: hypothetical protein B0A82_23450 [Alkalinema sp. CACIAM 70d]|nr:MAG: hypothetical protein B0A82_23450 [Alkalinema sp. CACIAM 70d]